MSLSKPRRFFALRGVLAAMVGGLVLMSQAVAQEETEQPRLEQRQQDRQREQDRNRDDDNRDQRDTRDRANREQDDRAQRMPDQGDDQGRAGLGVSIREGRGEGVGVGRVYPGSPAERAGIRSGDEILEVDGQRVDSPQSLMRTIGEAQPGREVEIRISRNGEEQTVYAELESRREAIGDQGRQFNRYRGQERMSNRPFRQDGREQYGDRQGYDPTPWGRGDLISHIEIMEREIRHLTDELDDLRRMVQQTPSQQSNYDDSQSFRDGRPQPPRGRDDSQEDRSQRDRRDR